MNPVPINENDLHAYVDGLLPEDRRACIEAWLLEHPEESARVQAYRSQNEALGRLFQPVADAPLPAHLRQLATPPADFQSAAVNLKNRFYLPFGSLRRIAAGIVIALVSGLAGWLGHGHFAPHEMAQAVPLSRQAAIAHVVYSPDIRRPVELGADQEEALVKWLSKRLGVAVNPPRLGAQGYELIGGRLLPGNSGPVAQFMYQDGSGQRLTLYLSTENAVRRDAGFRFAREGEVNVFYWVDGRFGYALSAGIDKAELARIATAVYDQLERK